MNNTTSLTQQLIALSDSDFYPFHMPGHKRTKLPFPNPWSIDITEIDGFDNLHHPKGILKELQEKTSRIFEAKESFCLVNGSTCGLLAAISACVKRGGKLLMARNCHKSSYHGVFLRQITPVYLMPEPTAFGILGSIDPKRVEEALARDPEIEAVLLVSPSYDGIVSDVRTIATIAHSYRVPLIVDEAHGAHFAFHGRFPKPALSCGADLVVQSFHKTLPSFTQSALLHIGRAQAGCGSLIDADKIRQFLQIYQSSSPSYLLLASLAQGMDLLCSEEGHRLFQQLIEHLDGLYRSSASLDTLRLFKKEEEPACFDHDISKILISSYISIGGQALYDILRESYHLQAELADECHVLLLCSLMDRKDGFERLERALFEIERDLIGVERKLALDKKKNPADIKDKTPIQAMTIGDALESPYRMLPLEDSLGQISQEFLYLYPPGIPLLAPGEVIEEGLLQNLMAIQESGLSIEGLADAAGSRIRLVIP